MSRRVVVTGWGAVSPIGVNARQTWQSLMADSGPIVTPTLSWPPA